MGFLGLFKDKEKPKKKKLSNRELAFKMAHNIFDDIVMNDEQIIHALNGKNDAENFFLSVGVLGVTDKRVLYYYQQGSNTGSETIMYDKIVSTTFITGYEAKMGSYIGIAIELLNGKKRIVRCLDKPDFKDMIKEMIFYIESKR